MVVKIPLNRGKRTSDKAVLESPATKTTMVTNEKDTPCNKFGKAGAAKKKKRRGNNQRLSCKAHEDDNSSISSRSSMNSASSFDGDVRDGINGGKTTAYTTTTDAAAATASSRALSSEDYRITVSSPSDQSREQVDNPYPSPDTLMLGKSLPHQNLDTKRSLSFILPPKASSPTPSTTSLDWQFSGSMEHFFEENDRAAGLSLPNDADKINTDGCQLEQYQLGSFDTVDSAERKLLLRESSNGDGSGTSHSTLKTTNRSRGRLPLPSPSSCFTSFPTGNSHLATTPLAPPTTSITDIFSPDVKGTTSPYLPRKKGGKDNNLFAPSPSEPNSSRFFMHIQPANSFSDLLTTPVPSNEEHPKATQPTSSQAASATLSKQKGLKNVETESSDKSDQRDIMQRLKDSEEMELRVPTPLGHNLEGHRRFVINGPLKNCTDSTIERVTTDNKKATYYQFLQMLSPAFEGCTFLLPWLRASETKSKVNVSLYGSFKLNKGTLFRHMPSGPSESDLKIAKRRIRSAICAFGGIINGKNEEEEGHSPVEKTVSFGNKSTSSIFRKRSGDDALKSPSPAPSTTSKSAGMKRKRNDNSILRREKYEKKLRDQYFENGNRLSWDVQHNIQLTLSGAKTFDEEDNSVSSSTKQDFRKTDKDTESNRPSKYKCTLCGALKKRHVCANRPIILRSIGVNVYPAANAYCADEPGSLACVLSEMNTFITSSSNSVCGLTSEEVGGDSTFPNHIQVTPCRAMKLYLRKSILSDPVKSHHQSCHREDSCNPSNDLTFQPSMDITNDHYLEVKSLPTDRGYNYPAVPLTFSQRKSMSDALLSISKSVPELTQACALILKDARRKNQWDQAVAELMAQVLCMLKCSSSKDYSLEGLRRYLLEFGISC